MKICDELAGIWTWSGTLPVGKATVSYLECTDYDATTQHRERKLLIQWLEDTFFN